MLDVAEKRAQAAMGHWEARSLGVVRAEAAAEFARAAGDTAPALVDPADPAFVVHPMYLVSLLRPEPGAEPGELRPDGMYRDEVPGTDGLDVRLMAGGQAVRWVGEVRVGDRVEVRRAVTAVDRKRPDLLLITVEKTYAAERGPLIEVTERFIVR
ncbi:MaoC family dehydratase N-terminal domain-containing protein [Streptomyces sp. GbtcB6]|uniref:FAS1-like dehydratase domain-containing protein n=1 Tax=Streptomyces sp. GbtcB6 TaxID=2824751 RepID=UPI001C2FD960|nr:MaoC family dehydratase N-terminal domain-containing protein [Streptomyces sp. GbtcB6]